jgi:hypothetical protein
LDTLLIIAPALVPVLQRIIDSGGDQKNNDTIQAEIVGDLAARGLDQSWAWLDMIPALGQLLMAYHFYGKNGPDPSYKLAPCVNLNDQAPGGESLVTTTEDPLVTAIVEPACPNWWKYRVFWSATGPLPSPTADDPDTTSSTPSSSPTATNICLSSEFKVNVTYLTQSADDSCKQRVTPMQEKRKTYPTSTNGVDLVFEYNPGNGTCVKDCPNIYNQMLLSCEFCLEQSRVSEG